MLRRTPHRSPWHTARPIGLRRVRVDAFRVYAMFVIIIGHSELLLGWASTQSAQALQLVLNIVSRAAVPLFFLLAGEHLAPRLARDRVRGAVWPYVRHLAWMFVIACLFYWVTDFLKLARSRGISEAVTGLIARQQTEGMGLILYGPRPHLWFLTVLMLVVLAAALILPYVRVRILVLGAAVLYGIGLALGPYHSQVDVVAQNWWYERLLQAPLFFAIGLVFGLAPAVRARSRAAITLIVVGVAAHAVEVHWIGQTYGTPPYRLTMLIGTVLYSTGVAMVALAPGANRVDRWVGRLAPYVPVVYLTHAFFLETLRPPRDAFPEPLVRILLPLLTIVLAFGSAWLLARMRYRFWRRRNAARAATAAA